MFHALIFLIQLTLKRRVSIEKSQVMIDSTLDRLESSIQNSKE